MVRKLADEGMTVLMIEHRVEDVLRIRPERVMFMDGGKVRYLGVLSGLSKVVNYHEVKLRAEDIVERAKQDKAPAELNILPGASANGSGSEALVKFENVAFGYEPDSEILHGINLEIKRGDVIAVLGPNGAGKTTFVKHAIGLLKPKSGPCAGEWTGYKRIERGSNCEHARLCFSKPKPYVVCADGARGVWIRAVEHEASEG